MRGQSPVSPEEAQLARALDKEGLFLKYLIGFSAAGLILCAGLFYLERAIAASATPQFCTLGSWLSCDKVLSSSYSKLLGIPLSVTGLVGFTIFLSLSSLRFFYPDKQFSHKAPTLLVIFSSAAILFEIYLTVVELFAIRSFCPLCLIGTALVVGVFISSIGLVKSAAELKASLTIQTASR